MIEPKPQILSVADYLASLEPGPKHQKIRDAFCALSEILKRAQQRTDARTGHIPEIRIRLTELVDAEGAPYAIYVNEGLINHCFSIEADAFYATKIEAIRLGLVPAIGYLALVWSVLHEFFHGAHTHNDRIAAEAQRGVHNKSAIARAAEFDADLCATALLYRYLQEHFAHFQRIGFALGSDIEVRQLTLCVIYSALRKLPDPQHKNELHVTRAERIHSIERKIAALGVSQSDKVDRTLELPETRDRYKAILACTQRCEEIFVNLHGSAYGDFAAELNAVDHSGDWSHYYAWEDMANQSPPP